MPVIYSTCAADNKFPVYKEHSRVAAYDHAVTIKGGAGVQSKLTLLTPRGAATTVSAEELAFLKSNPAFMGFVERGYMAIDEKASEAHEGTISKAAVSMNADDNGAQDTEVDYKKMGKKAPKEAV